MSQASIIQSLDLNPGTTKGEKVITARREGEERTLSYMYYFSFSTSLFFAVAAWEMEGRRERKERGEGGRSNNQGLNIAFVRMFRTDCMNVGKKGEGEKETIEIKT